MGVYRSSSLSHIHSKSQQTPRHFFLGRQSHKSGWKALAFFLGRVAKMTKAKKKKQILPSPSSGCADWLFAVHSLRDCWLLLLQQCTHTHCLLCFTVLPLSFSQVAFDQSVMSGSHWLSAGSSGGGGGGGSMLCTVRSSITHLLLRRTAAAAAFLLFKRGFSAEETTARWWIIAASMVLSLASSLTHWSPIAASTFSLVVSHSCNLLLLPYSTLPAACQSWLI